MSRLDVSQHMALCRHYVRELRRSMILETPDPDKAAGGGSKRSSRILNDLPDPNDPAGPSMPLTRAEKARDDQMSAFLRTERGDANHSPHSSLGSAQSHPNSNYRASNSGDLARPRPSYMSTPGQDSSSPGHTVSRADIKHSAEQILYTYLLENSEREIVIPRQYLEAIQFAIEHEERDDPEVFEDAKDYVFQAMERDAYPAFLRAKALGNLVPPSAMMRVVLGLMCLFAGFWAGFYCILTNKSRATKCFVSLVSSPPSSKLHDVASPADDHEQLIIPFTLGIYFLVSWQYYLDPIIAYAHYSEYTFFNFSRIREPYVQKMLYKRGLMVFAMTAGIAICLNVLFIFVPGKHL